MDPGEATHFEVLAVARAHGTLIASAWSGWDRKRIVRWRKRVDGYTRGRGHPTLAELAMRAPRADCSCPRCVAYFTAKARTSVMLREMAARLGHGRAWGATKGAAPVEAGEPWLTQGHCAGVDPAVFYPKGRRGGEPGPTERRLFAPAKLVCAGCPVKATCLEEAMRRGELGGVWGGLDEFERADLATERAIGASAN